MLRGRLLFYYGIYYSIMEIVILDGYVANPGDLSWDGLEKMGNLTVYDRTPADLVVERAKNADVVIINKILMTADVISRLPKLKLICVFATGYNNIDIQAAANRGVTVCNVPSYSTDSVAQQVFSLLLAITNRVADYSAKVSEGDWQNCRDFSFTLGPVYELAGMTIGIYGLGHIGSKVAEIAHAFGMKVISPTSKPQSILPEYVTKVTFDEFLVHSDVISVNAPLAADNKEIFCKATFSKMHRGVIFINTARGQLVNEQDLADALRSGQVGAAGLDVLEQEPPRSGSPVIGLPNCFVTPHIAWQSTAARNRLLEITAENVAAWMAGNPQNVVKP